MPAPGLDIGCGPLERSSDDAGERAGPALALLEPDRPHNLGAAVRLAACLGVALHVIEPAGFPLHDRRIREAALDYGGAVQLHVHPSFAAFDGWRRGIGRRLVLLGKAAGLACHDARYGPRDVLLLGRESTGAPRLVHEAAELAVKIPMAPGMRSLNVAIAAALVLAEALRQTGAFDRLVNPAEGSGDGGAGRGMGR